MTDKKERDWADYLIANENARLVGGSSSMPADEFTFTDGSNGGLDGFYFDLEMNEGVADGARLPESKGLSGLPDGIVTSPEASLEYDDLMESDDGPNLEIILDDGLPVEEEEGIVLDDDMQEVDKLAALTNLDWLDPTQEQDPTRLPHRPILQPELNVQWGGNKSTDGLFLVPNKDREAVNFYNGIQEGPHSGLPTGNPAAIKEATMRASRRVHYGHNLREIAKELVQTAGVELTKKVMAQLQEDYGLAGNVFVRASVFPGIKNGKWAKELKRTARNAIYVITNDQAVADKLGMDMVDEVPWDEALAYYKPKMVAAGYRIATGDAKNALRRAFLSGPDVAVPQETYKPVHRPPEATEAQVQAAMAAPVEVEIPKTAEEMVVDKKRREAMVKMARWVKANRLSQVDALKIYDSGMSAEGMLKAAALIITATQGVAVYDGVGARLPKDAQLARQRVLADVEQRQAALETEAKKKFMVYLAKKVKSGALTQKEAQRIADMNKPVAELQKVAAAAIKVAAESRTAYVDVPEAKQYAGAVQKVAIHTKTTTPVDPFLAKVMKVAGDTGIKTGEIIGLLKWARQQMNEGMAGEKLDQLLLGKFSRPLLAATTGLLKDVRATHEGLAGFMYVDAEAYASPSGTTGCERGALKHRANNIKMVLPMSRCNGCVFANAEDVCQQYNKRLTHILPDESVEARRLQNIHLANADDSERTASIFDPGEFNLQARGDIDLDANVTPEKLGKVLFGGPELED